MENLKRLEEQKAREDKVRLEKLAEAAKKQQERERELEEKAAREKREAGRAAAPAAAPSSTGSKFVVRASQPTPAAPAVRLPSPNVLSELPLHCFCAGFPPGRSLAACTYNTPLEQCQCTSHTFSQRVIEAHVWSRHT